MRLSSRAKKWIWAIFRSLLMVLIAVFAFLSGESHQKKKRMSHPKWGTVLCEPKMCKKELGPVFYFEQQCKVVAKALDELDGQKRKCVKMVK